MSTWVSQEFPARKSWFSGAEPGVCRDGHRCAITGCVLVVYMECFLPHKHVLFMDWGHVCSPPYRWSFTSRVWSILATPHSSTLFPLGGILVVVFGLCVPHKNIVDIVPAAQRAAVVRRVNDRNSCELCFCVSFELCCRASVSFNTWRTDLVIRGIFLHMEANFRGTCFDMGWVINFIKYWFLFSADRLGTVLKYCPW